MAKAKKMEKKADKKEDARGKKKPMPFGKKKK
jgi:hypothetical protein